MPIKAILFDLVGTTIKEKNPDFIINCFQRAFKENNISVDAQLIKSNRGKDKNEIIKIILNEINHPPYPSNSIMDSFVKILDENLDNFSEMDGLRDIIKHLKKKNILVGIGTGLSRNIFDKIFIHLNLNNIHFDYIGIAEETGRGRPHPDMIFDMMKNYDLTKSEFLKVGDTASDIQEGKNAGVHTAAILSGTQDEKELVRENPDYIIRELIELKDLI